MSDSLKRRELLEDFLFWYFDSFVLSLLKVGSFIIFWGLFLILALQTAFYVTESSAFRNQILYFRHDDWAALCAPLIDRLTSVTFEKLTAVSSNCFCPIELPETNLVELDRSCRDSSAAQTWILLH